MDIIGLDRQKQQMWLKLCILAQWLSGSKNGCGDRGCIQCLGIMCL